MIRQAFPKSLNLSDQKICIPAPDALMLFAFSACANDKGRHNCPSTAAWYRWDMPIPMNLSVSI